MARVESRNGMLISLSSFLNLFSKHASRVTKKLKPAESKIGSRTPLASPRQLLRKLTTFGDKKKDNKQENPYGGGFVDHDEEGFGDGGLWQRGILMGEKCQPPDFSGVIYYDPYGNQVSEFSPKSPRATPLPGYAFGMKTRDM
ncbi:hypothetical protein ACHQM5_005829 [Ranunculus cassubicifolius]